MFVVPVSAQAKTIKGGHGVCCSWSDSAGHLHVWLHYFQPQRSRIQVSLLHSSSLIVSACTLLSSGNIPLCYKDLLHFTWILTLTSGIWNRHTFYPANIGILHFFFQVCRLSEHHRFHITVCKTVSYGAKDRYLWSNDKTSRNVTCVR